MIDRHANRLMVAYLYIEPFAMYFAEDWLTLEAPPHGVRADRHNHVWLAAGDVRLN